jgi:type 1 fimbria pilin
MSHFHPLFKRGRRLLTSAALLLAACLGLAHSPTAHAGATLACTSPTNNIVYTLTMPSSVTATSNLAIGSTFGSTGSVTVTFNCSNVISQYKKVTPQAAIVATLDPTNKAGAGYVVLGTNLPGVAIKLTGNPTNPDSGLNGPGGTPGWELSSKTNTSSSVSETFTAQLIKTGPIGPGTVNALTIVQLTNYSYGNTDSSPYYASVATTSVAVNTPSCSLTMPSANFAVALPTVSANALKAVGATAGATPFNITYNCGTSLTVSMYMTTPNAGSSAGLMLPDGVTCTGAATNVALQLLMKSQAVTFNTSQKIGTASGNLTIPFVVQYYATATPVSSGSVCTTATYTLTYQ